MKLLVVLAASACLFAGLAITVTTWLFIISFVFFVIWLSVLWVYEDAANAAKQLNRQHGTAFTADDMLYNPHLVEKALRDMRNMRNKQ